NNGDLMAQQLLQALSQEKERLLATLRQRENDLELAFSRQEELEALVEQFESGNGAIQITSQATNTSPSHTSRSEQEDAEEAQLKRWMNEEKLMMRREIEERSLRIASLQNQLDLQDCQIGILKSSIEQQKVK